MKIATNQGRKWQWRKGRIFLGIGGDIYALHFEFYRFTICIDSSNQNKRKKK